jgi:hypothetical protein
MIRAWIVLGVGVGYLGCGGSQDKPTTNAGSGSSSTTVIAKKISVSWGIQPAGQPNEQMADIFLATTDETGKQISHQVGTYKGSCKVFTPAAEMNALTGVQCRSGDGGTELHAVTRGGDEIVVLQMGITKTPDPMAREEVTRVKVPLGVKIEVGS